MKHVINIKVEFIEKSEPILNDESNKELLRDKIKDLFAWDSDVKLSENMKDD